MSCECRPASIPGAEIPGRGRFPRQCTKSGKPTQDTQTESESASILLSLIFPERPTVVPGRNSVPMGIAGLGAPMKRSGSTQGKSSRRRKGSIGVIAVQTQTVRISSGQCRPASEAPSLNLPRFGQSEDDRTPSPLGASNETSQNPPARSGKRQVCQGDIRKRAARLACAAG